MPETTQKFELIFFEEMSEHLEEMESLLLDMDETLDNTEALNAIFRAVHSIKGGSGIFGFEEISTVTHILENLLDKLRNHDIELSKDMISIFLQTRDLLESLKDAHQYENNEPVPASSIKAVCGELDKLCQEHIPDYDSKQSQAPTEEVVDTTDELLAELSEEEKKAVKILLVEDSKVNQKFVTVVLKKIGFTSVEIAENGQLALDKLNASIKEPFQILLLDCQMPVMDGYEATQEIRKGNAGEANIDVAIIAMTGMSGEKEKQKCLDCGMDDYLVKPIKADSVSEKIRFWINKAKNRTTVVPTQNAKKVVKKSLPTKRNEVSSIRVSTTKVDQLINQVGELIITQSMLQKLTIDLGLEGNELLMARIKQLESNTRDLQASAMSVRMMPIGTVFGRFPRIIRDLSVSLNKKIKLIIEGEQTELDKGLLEMLVDPLTHLIRNSIDHGIELPEQRLKANKNAEGVIKLSAVYRGGDVIVHVDDDGAGIDPNKILEKARKTGMKLPEDMTEEAIFQLIFSAGFSTAEVVTDVSGRGVGMDVVKKNIARMGGKVEISSNIGMGSRVSIQLPLTLAILEGMSVCVGEDIYIIPLTYIVESLQPKAENLKILNSGEMMLRVNEEYIPILCLYKFFNLETQVKQIDKGIVVLLEHDKKVIALFVDSLVGQQQVVLKKLENNFKKVPCISGATILGDGRVSLILDVADLVRQF
jgi:two-component system chemotaxis sensor kinase CheA